jgi:hypothetical protein
LAAEPAPALNRYFTIEVVDAETGRGVPLVDLETTNNIHYYTDSNGIVAFHEPGLMNQKVYFHVRSHGYEYPKDKFGYRGVALQIQEGGSARIRLPRRNIAERLYRVTGEGIYRDSVLVGRSVPIREPVLNGLVFGSDSVVQARYHGQLYWFWGDTNRPGYPLGNFQVPGATSQLPGQGGLDPEAGVNLNYFVDKTGFVSETCRMPGEGPTWIFGLATLKDAQGGERMFAAYMKVRGQLNVYERGLCEWNDKKKKFEKVTAFPKDFPAYPNGQTLVRTEQGVEYVYYTLPYPWLRVRAVPESLERLEEYESFTPLKEGGTKKALELDRGPDGTLRYGWKKKTAMLQPSDQKRLIKEGKLKQEETLAPLQDVETGKFVTAHTASVYWNEYRRRWVMIVLETFGTSLLGEVWYAESDHPLGPWVYARKVVTHDNYSFYNPRHHPAFDKEGGRLIFFEATYTHTFSSNPVQTPRYDYNQIMYKLDLAHTRLRLPVAVSTASDAAVPNHFVLGPARKPSQPIAFFALDRPGDGTVSLYVAGGRLVAGAAPQGQQPVFHALPVDVAQPATTTVPLYEWLNAERGVYAYSADPSWTRPGFQRAEKPLCRVWRSPTRVTIPD